MGSSTNEVREPLKLTFQNGEQAQDTILRRIVLAVLSEMGVTGVSQEDIENAVSSYMSNHPIEGITENEVSQIVADYMSNHPIDTLSESEVNNLISEYMSEHSIEGVSEEQIVQSVNQYLEDKKDTILAIQKYGKRQFEKSRGTVIYDFDINNIVGSTSFEYEYDFSKVKRSVRALKLSTDDTLRNASVVLKLNTEIAKAEATNYGMWFYVPSITYEHLSYIQLKGGIYTSNTFSNGEVICQIPKTSLGQGWNFWKFNEPANTTFNAISIMIVDESSSSDTTHFAKEVYFDSIIKGYELNPTILLTFDNSTDENLYDYCFKQAKTKGVVGTFAYQNGSSPDGAVLGSAYTNGVTREHLKEMIQSGWDCTQYDGYPLDSGINAIKAYNKALKDENLDMYCYFARFNRMTADIFNSLDSMDFKMARISNSEKYNSALGQSAYTSVGLTFSNGFSSIKSNVDYAITHGKILCIVIHKVLDTQDSTENNCLKSDYEELINYLAEKQSNNELKIATFKELYYSDLRTEIINVVS